jgi:hypothetical protein
MDMGCLTAIVAMIAIQGRFAIEARTVRRMAALAMRWFEHAPDDHSSHGIARSFQPACHIQSPPFLWFLGHPFN